MTGHSAHDAAHYVPKELFEEWGKLDPIVRLEKQMLENGWADRSRTRRGARRDPARSGRGRRLGRSRAPYPDPATLLDDVYENQ